MLLESAHLQPDVIYGCDRLLCKSYADWQKLIATGYMTQSHDFHNRVNIPAGYSIGSRWADRIGGYCPLGFFQCAAAENYFLHGARIKPYPMHHSDACRTDVQHSLQFDRAKRQLIPELIVVHLESEPNSRLGANWQGRTTKRFGPILSSSPASASY
jgi:hypothetical protein